MLVANTVTSAFLAMAFVRAHPEPFILAVCGVFLILGGKLLKSRKKQNGGEDFRSSYSRENADAAAAVRNGAETNSLITPSWDTVEWTSTLQSLPLPKPAILPVLNRSERPQTPKNYSLR